MMTEQLEEKYFTYTCILSVVSSLHLEQFVAALCEDIGTDSGHFVRILVIILSRSDPTFMSITVNIEMSKSSSNI